MLATRLAREDVHPDRDCVDDQLYFAQVNARSYGTYIQDMMMLSARAVREKVHLAVGENSLKFEFAFDQVLFTQDVMEVDMLTTRLAREEVHSDRDCVDDQLYFAQDMMEKMTAPSTQFVRGRIQNTVDCTADQVFFAHTVMEVDMLTTRLAR